MLFSLYTLKGADLPKTYYTACPKVDILHWREQHKDIVWLSEPMPLGKLVPLRDDFLNALRRKKGLFPRMRNLLGFVGGGQDAKETAATFFGSVDSHVTNDSTILPTVEEKEQLLNLLRGRILFPEEIRRAVAEQSLNFLSPLIVILQMLYLEGQLDIFPALIDSKEGQRCYRCGEKDKIIAAHCASCGDTQCRYCDNCTIMGQARTCQALFAVSDLKEKVTKDIVLCLDFELTNPQKDAFRGVREFISQDKPLGVVWAACGAGKTEVSFGAIRETLARGGKVLYATPRKDVVIELEPRIRKAFPGVRVSALYGGSDNKYQEADMFIATTHQCLRFFRAFDLVVLDEADAFPYDGSEMLYLAVERARTFNGKLLYMSATPSQEMLNWTKSGRASKYTIPARYHGYPLPEPYLVIDKNISYPTKSAKIALPQTIIDFIIKSVEEEKAQVFVFVPTISSAEPVAELLRLKLAHKSYVISYSFARDAEKDAKRKDFTEGRTDVFVTTSIMERGITIPRANVLVLFADFMRIYSWRSLVQMAGRSGRTADYPRGKVWFAACTKSEAMYEAVQVIVRMNKEAMKKGYLK